MILEMLEKYFNENPWSDLTNLDELIKLTGLDETSIKVSFFCEFVLILFKHEIYNEK